MIDLWQRAPTVKQLRSFGLTVGLAFLALGVLAFVRHPDGTARWILVLVGTPLVAFGLAQPGLLRLPYQLWMALGTLLGFISTTVILTVTYLTIFVLVRLAMRLMRRDPLDRTWQPGRATTYWREREVVDVPERHLRPF